MSQRCRVHRPRYSLLLLLFLLPVPAFAIADALRFDIPAQPLPDALKVFAGQAKMQLLYKSDAVSSGTSNPVIGDFEKRDALELLLEGTGFEAVYSRGNAATIRPVSSAPNTTATSISATQIAWSDEAGVRLAQSDASAASGAENRAEPRLGMEKAAADSSSNTDRQQVEEILVTARKRTERLQDVPVQVTVLDEQTIRDARVDSILEIYENTSSMYSMYQSTPLESYIFIRGIGNAGGASAESSVAFVMDGVYVQADSFINGDILGVQRIEVLKGPQTTLYGKSAVAGAVLITSKMPSDEFEAEGEVRYGTGEDLRLQAAASVPIVPGVFGSRLTVGYRDYGGLYEDQAGRPIDDQRDVFLKGVFEFTPNDAITIRPIFMYRDHDETTYAYGRTIDERDYDNVIYERSDGNDYSVDNFSGSVSIDWTLGKYTLTSVSAYNDTDEFFQVDIDYQPENLLIVDRQTDKEQLSQELRITSPADATLRWIAGAFYYRLEDNQFQRLYGDLFGPGVIVGAEKEVVSKTYSIFSQLDYDLTSTLTLTLGGRYDWEERSIFEPTLADRSADFNYFSPKVSLGYRPAEDWLTYASWAIGRRPGGFNGFGFPSFGKEKATQYELGFKSTLLGGRMTANGAVFLTEMENQQLFDIDLSTATELIRNLGESRIWGVEVELRMRLTETLSAFAGYTYLDGEYTDYSAVRLGPDGVMLYDFDGNDTIHTPDYRLVTALDYARPLGDGPSLTGRLDARFEGRHAWNEWNTAYQEPYQVVDASVGLDFGRFQAKVYVDNLFDEDYFSAFVSPFQFGFSANALAVEGRERTWGVSLSAQF